MAEMKLTLRHCEEAAQHGNNCFCVDRAGTDYCEYAHVTYNEAYYLVHGVWPDEEIGMNVSATVRAHAEEIVILKHHVQQDMDMIAVLNRKITDLEARIDVVTEWQMVHGAALDMFGAKQDMQALDRVRDAHMGNVAEFDWCTGSPTCQCPQCRLAEHNANEAPEDQIDDTPQPNNNLRGNPYR